MKTKTNSTHKKVVVETRKGETHRGYVKFESLADPAGLEMLDSDGQLHAFTWKSLKIIWVVSDWEARLPDLAQVTFSRRPRTEGLWIRLQFRDDTAMEGILVNNLLKLPDHGYMVSPPSVNGDHYTAFVPKPALKEATVVSVVGAGSRSSSRRRRVPAPGQASLFET